MRGLRRFLIVLALLGVGACIAWQFAPPSREEILLFDDLGLPAELLDIEARVVRGRFPGLMRGVGGVLVSFDVDGVPVGAASTDDDGRATVRSAPRGLGDFHLSATAKGPTGRTLGPVTGRLRVVPSNDPLLVCDIDGTLADVSGLAVLWKSDDEIRPLDGAIVGLRRLALRYGVIYLTRRDADLMARTRSWLAKHDFPPGPIFFSRSLHDPLGASAYKADTLRFLRRRFDGIALGIGNRASDAEAYLENGLSAYLVGPEEAPPKALSFPNWDALIAAFDAGGAKRR